ncbi:MAG TPA: pseudouridine synthase, partial [Bacteroidales bacterium]|nr:pseudouridine synthase [Bacteroidales bacterium]
KQVKGSKRASLDYQLVLRTDNFYVLEINLHTGRHHQIRCQLAAAGCPIKGDLKYGFPRSNNDGSISLHAWKIQYLHPVRKKEMEIVAPVPESGIWLKIRDMI